MRFCCLLPEQQGTSTNLSRRFSVSRETGVSSRARAFRQQDQCALPCALTRFSRRLRRPRFTCATKQRQRRRRHAVDFRRVADGARALRGKFLFHFVGQSRQRCVVDLIRQQKIFIATISGDVGRLAREIDVVLRIDFDLLGDVWRELGKARPDFCRSRNRNVRMRQQFKRAATLSIFVQREPVTFGFLRRQRNEFGKFARVVEC